MSKEEMNAEQLHTAHVKVLNKNYEMIIYILKSALTDIAYYHHAEDMEDFEVIRRHVETARKALEETE